MTRAKRRIQVSDDRLYQQFNQHFHHHPNLTFYPGLNPPDARQRNMDKQMEGLKWVIRALAQPAHIQKKLFPSFTFPEDEMIWEFEQYFTPTSSRYTDQWSGAQYLSLRDLDEQFAALSGLDDEDLWYDENCLEDPEWTEIRKGAHKVLQAFSWPTDEPPPSQA